MSDKLREGSIEQCYFCGINYIEQWPLEILAVTMCPGCGSMATADLYGKYPEKFEAMPGYETYEED